MFVVNRLIDIVFMAEIVVSFCEKYPASLDSTEGVIWISDPRRIAWHYITGCAARARPKRQPSALHCATFVCPPTVPPAPRSFFFVDFMSVLVSIVDFIAIGDGSRDETRIAGPPRAPAPSPAPQFDAASLHVPHPALQASRAWCSCACCGSCG